MYIICSIGLRGSPRKILTAGREPVGCEEYTYAQTHQNTANSLCQACQTQPSPQWCGAQEFVAKAPTSC